MSGGEAQRSEQQFRDMETAVESAAVERSAADAGDVRESGFLHGEASESDNDAVAELGHATAARDDVAGAARPATAGSAASSGAASSSGGLDQLTVAQTPMTMRTNILQLKEAQKKLREENNKYAREVRNTERRSKRLKTRVLGLSDADLNEVLRARAEVACLDTKRKKGAAKSSGNAQSSCSPTAQKLPRSVSSVNLETGPIEVSQRPLKKRKSGEDPLE